MRFYDSIWPVIRLDLRVFLFKAILKYSARESVEVGRDLLLRMESFAARPLPRKFTLLRLVKSTFGEEDRIERRVFRLKRRICESDSPTSRQFIHSRKVLVLPRSDKFSNVPNFSISAADYRDFRMKGESRNFSAKFGSILASSLYSLVFA